MPNWCNNELHVVGPEVDVAKFREKAVDHSPWPEDQTETPSRLNLHSLVPIPADVLAAGYAAGQRWEEANWGCHWGACHVQVDESPGRLHYWFDTPWCPPLMWLARVARDWPSLSFSLSYDEPGVCSKGVASAQGEKMQDRCIDY